MKTFHLSIKIKFTLMVFIILISLAFLLAAAAFTNFSVKKDVLLVNQKLNDNTALIELLNLINTTKFRVNKLLVSVKNYMINKDNADLKKIILKEIQIDFIILSNLTFTIQNSINENNLFEMEKISKKDYIIIINEIRNLNNELMELIEKDLLYKDFIGYNSYFELDQKISLRSVKINEKLDELAVMIHLTSINSAVELKISQEKLNKQVKSSFYFSLVFSALTMIIIILLFILISSKLLKQIGRGVNFARSIENNDFSHRLNMNDKDEFGILSHALDKMADQIEKYTDRLSEKNKKLNYEIGEREKAEAELKKLQSLLLNIINSMPSVLVGVDINGFVTHWNNEAERLSGISGQSAKGRLIFEIFPDLKKDLVKIKQAISSRKPVIDHNVQTEVHNEIRYEDIAIYPLVTNGIEGAVVRIDDVTSRFKLEEMMIQSEKMLSVGGLAAGMAHEINNPLAGIIQNLQVINYRLTGNSDKDREIAEECGTTVDKIKNYIRKREIFNIIEIILESGKRASQIVNNMLSFAKKSNEVFTECRITELMDKTIDIAMNDYDLLKKHDFKSINIVKEYEEHIPCILCDESKIQQVFLNILKNGAEAMFDKFKNNEEGSPEFKIRIGIEYQKDLKIEIIDNGPGMDEAVTKKIFEPFFTTKKTGAGTGLGLSISYFIITENHKGSITAVSKPGAGTNFIIKLPLRIQNEK